MSSVLSIDMTQFHSKNKIDTVFHGCCAAETKPETKSYSDGGPLPATQADLSLVMSLSNRHDERIEMCVDEISEKVWG